MSNLIIKSTCFDEGGWIPLDNTARGLDLSPDFQLSGIDKKAVSLAITMDDTSHPLFPNYNHWLIWNVKPEAVIPKGIPSEKVVDSMSGAVQGIAYGRHKYKGPKPPKKSIHIYVFTVYVLDCKLSLSANSRRKDLFKAMEGHVLQKATLSGKFQNTK